MDASLEPSPAPPKTSLRRELLTLVGIAVFSLSLALFLRLCVAQAYEIRGKSMFPTFDDGDRVILNKIKPLIFGIELRDIVIFSHPDDPDRELVKRVVAQGGDSVRIEGGKLYVNDARFHVSPGSLWRYTASHGSRDEWEVPEGAYFVLGDNTENSQDSRDFGPVPEGLIRGTVWFKWWPPRRAPARERIHAR